jgi:hypothetical protein
MRLILMAFIAMLLSGISAFGGAAFAQSAKDLIGTWTLVSVTLEEGGNKTEPFGPSPKGMSIFDGTRQSTVIVRAEMPKFASNNRNSGTADENKAAVQGSLAFFGSYTFDEASKSVTTKIDGSSFPNWMGVEQKRTIAIANDTLTVTNPVPSAGGPGGVATVIWKRAK